MRVVEAEFLSVQEANSKQCVGVQFLLLVRSDGS